MLYLQILKNNPPPSPPTSSYVELVGGLTRHFRVYIKITVFEIHFIYQKHKFIKTLYIGYLKITFFIKTLYIYFKINFLITLIHILKSHLEKHLIYFKIIFLPKNTIYFKITLRKILDIFLNHI